MSHARREPPTIDRNAPLRRIPMKPAGDLVDHQGFIVGVVEPQVTCPEFERPAASESIHRLANGH
jgi:hypothetical protein